MKCSLFGETERGKGRVGIGRKGGDWEGGSGEWKTFGQEKLDLSEDVLVKGRMFSDKRAMKDV